jgi:hypothetical protein
MKALLLRRRIAVLCSRLLSVMGGFATTAFVFDADAAALPGRGPGGWGTPCHENSPKRGSTRSFRVRGGRSWWSGYALSGTYLTYPSGYFGA